MIIVTGGLGFIGNEVVRQLKNKGENVAIIDNRNRVAPDIEDLIDVPVFEADVTNREKVLEIFRQIKPETVIHLAAIHYIPECNENPERTLKMNVEGTQNILRVSAETGVKKILFASSGAVYADSGELLNEDSPLAPVDIYGWSKLFGENLCRLNYSLYGVPTVICRLFNNYGPRETNLHIVPEILRQLRQGDTLGLGVIKTIRDYIHTSDCSNAIISLAEAEIRGVETYNIATGKGHTVEDIINIVAEITGRKLKIVVDQSRLRKFDKLIQVADMRNLENKTGWKADRSMHDGLVSLLKYEKFI